ncbi:Uncharacterized protein P5673_024148 [Acropora cervicornis]|uniref:Macro domain-containing protein n=1 Tax=Acropora cervicornis TaxID=6130 RepID=A0AAD9UYN5_ACRCE|nr:Uncharacterized protein P5673_024148 [Acropora cervicornis]
MTSGKDRILSLGPQRKILSEEQVARSVVVTNLKRQTLAEQAKNGGGELECVHIPHEGKAVITFASKEVAEKISENQHNIDGSELKFHPLVCAKPVKVFESLKARLSPCILSSLRKDGRSVKRHLKETRVEFHKIARDHYVFSGSLPQIQAMGDRLLQHVAGVKEVKENTSATGNTHPVSPRSVDKPFSESSSYLEVQPPFMKLLQRIHKNTISNMEQRFGIKIIWEENTSQVWVHPARKTSNGNDSCKEGCDEFIDLYKNVIQNVSRNVVHPPKEAGGELIDKTIIAFQEDHPAVCEREGNTVVIYAEKDRSRSFYRTLEERLHSIAGSNRLGNITNPSSLNNQRLQSFPDSQPLGGIQLSNGVLFSLYQADITKVNVDAIVNAANERLQHGGGVAGAIVRHGGYQIQFESSEIVRRHGPIPVGEAVETRAGLLPCQYVIHTVGPRWNEQRKEGSKFLLRQACLASLNLAATILHLSSIALPAISSGIFGMPKDICAQVIFKAVEEFSQSEYAEVSRLRDVRIVIIDEPTIRVFHEEFMKRYRSKKALPEDFSNSGHPQDKEKQNSFIPNPSEGPRKPQKNDSAGNGNQDSDKVKNDSTKVEPPGQATTVNEESYESLKRMSLSSGKDNEKTGGDPVGANGTNFNFPLKSGNGENENTSRKSALGRGILNLAITFSNCPGKEMSQSSPSPFSHGQNGREESDLPSTNAKANPSAPGLMVTDEGKDVAEQFNGAKGDNQETSGTDSVQNKGNSIGSSSQDVDQSLKLHGEVKDNREPLTEGSSNGAQGKERNPSQSPKHDNTSSNHVKRDNATQTDSVAAETQDSQPGPCAEEIVIKNALSETAWGVMAFHDKSTKNICEEKVNNDKEPIDCTQGDIHISNQAATHSGSPQLQHLSSSVEQSSGSEDNTADSNPGPQLDMETSEGSSTGAQGKQRNPSQSPKHDDTPANHMKQDNSTQTSCVAAESGPSAGEISVKNASSETPGSFNTVHDKRTKNICEGKPNHGNEPMECTQEETHSLNQVATQSSSSQFQTSSSSVKQSSGNQNNVVDSNRPGPQ